VVPCHQIFIAAILKGLVEHNDSTHHFGSLLGFSEYLNLARFKGVVDRHGEITEKGKELYDEWNLKALPNTRSVYWDCA
jgi:hypothetical protein